MTAEKRPASAGWSSSTRCFNEAAADDRGKRVRGYGLTAWAGRLQ